MSVRVLTLFGEEIIPEQMNAVGRPAKTKKAKAEPEEEPEEITEEAARTEYIANVEAVTPNVEQPVTEATTEAPAKPARTKKKAVVKRRSTKPTPAEVVQPEPVAPAETTDFLDGWAGDKQYYTIGEVAKIFNVATSHIRFWTNEFELKVRTTRKGDRLYTPEQVREIRGIFHLVKEKKYTISGAKAKLKEKTVSVQSIDLKKSLLHLRNKLLTIRNQLR